MARRIRYQMGDLFLIPLDQQVTGIGRALLKDEDTIFVELYNLKSVDKSSAWHAKDADVVQMAWTYDTNLRNGTWEILGNRPVDEPVKMPNFWSDGADGKLYITPGSESAFGDTANVREATPEEVASAYLYGILHPNMLREIYLDTLKEKGLV